MTGPDWLKPADAAARYGVSEKTLSRWAASGLISRSHPAGLRSVLYRAADIAEVIEAGASARRVVPLAPTTPTTRPAAADELDAFWSTPTSGRGR